MNTKWLFESSLALKSTSTSAKLIEERCAESLAFQTKGTSRDIVTELDIIIEKHIKEILGTSKYQIIGEETSKNGDLNIIPNEPTWFIDPIDGTANFISSMPFYAISVGLATDSEFLVGAVVAPALKEIFFTMGDKGSFMNGKILKVCSADLRNSLIAVGFSGSYSNEIKRKQEYLFFGILNDNSRGCLRLGSASVNICYVAAGRLQSAYGISNKIWDVAGAIAIAIQAGCKVYIDWIKETHQISSVVGAGGVTDKIAEMLKEEKIANLSPINL